VESAVEAVVHAMRAAKIDPEDSAGYTMVSFYGFYPIPDPSAFAEQLQQLWAPFKTLGRVRSLLTTITDRIVMVFSHTHVCIVQVYVAKEGVNAQMAVPDNAVLYFEQAIRCLPVFANRRLNTDHIVSREEYARTQPFRA
jgi:predicted sulfurtransferase